MARHRTQPRTGNRVLPMREIHSTTGGLVPSITCTLCEENQAVMVATNLDGGDTVAPCGPCLPGYSLSLAAAMTDGMPPEIAEAYGDMFDAVAANDSRIKKSQKSRSKPSSHPGQTASTPEPSTETDTTADSLADSGTQSSQSTSSNREQPNDQDWRDDHALDLSNSTDD
jgi:hypothetical protein